MERKNKVINHHLDVPVRMLGHAFGIVEGEKTKPDFVLMALLNIIPILLLIQSQEGL